MGLFSSNWKSRPHKYTPEFIEDPKCRRMWKTMARRAYAIDEVACIGAAGLASIVIPVIGDLAYGFLGYILVIRLNEEFKNTFQAHLDQTNPVYAASFKAVKKDNHVKNIASLILKVVVGFVPAVGDALALLLIKEVCWMCIMQTVDIMIDYEELIMEADYQMETGTGVMGNLVTVAEIGRGGWKARKNWSKKKRRQQQDSGNGIQSNASGNRRKQTASPRRKAPRRRRKKGIF